MDKPAANQVWMHRNTAETLFVLDEARAQAEGRINSRGWSEWITKQPYKPKRVY